MKQIILLETATLRERITHKARVIRVILEAKNTEKGRWQEMSTQTLSEYEVEACYKFMKGK